MEETRNKLIHLHAILFDNWQLISKMHRLDNTFQQIYEMSSFQLQETFQLSSEKASYLHEHLRKELTTYDQTTTITIFDDNYPPLLKEIYDPPFVLYAKGNTDLLQTNMLAVVGTRKPTIYGYESLKFLMKDCPENTFTIVSGLALGVDTYAHQLAMKHNHATVGVIGSGFHHLYPTKNRQLAEEIDLLLSEYPPNSPPRKWYFPKRNRIISGLSMGTIIVEAKEKSGSLITADCALEQGREVFAVPTLITTDNSKGVHKLIQQGAKLTTTFGDILEELFIC